MSTSNLGNQCNYDKYGHKSDTITKTVKHSSTKEDHHAALVTETVLLQELIECIL